MPVKFKSVIDESQSILKKARRGLSIFQEK
jgi:hypothetical protein